MKEPEPRAGVKERVLGDSQTITSTETFTGTGVCGVQFRHAVSRPLSSMTENCKARRKEYIGAKRQMDFIFLHIP